MAAENVAAETSRQLETFWRRHVMLATVVGTVGNTVQIQRNSPGLDPKYYARFEGKWSLVAGDVVGVIDFTGSGGWVVIGKIGGDTSP